MAEVIIMVVSFKMSISRGKCSVGIVEADDPACPQTFTPHGNAAD